MLLFFVAGTVCCSLALYNIVFKWEICHLIINIKCNDNRNVMKNLVTVTSDLTWCFQPSNFDLFWQDCCIVCFTIFAYSIFIVLRSMSSKLDRKEMSISQFVSLLQNTRFRLIYIDSGSLWEILSHLAYNGILKVCYVS